MSTSRVSGCRAAAMGAALLAGAAAGEGASLCTAPAARVAPPPGATVLGNGAPGSVDQSDIQAALDAGGFIRFDVGSSPVTIPITAELVVSKAVVVDGGGVVTLSGGGVSRVFLATNPANAVYTFTLQDLTIADGATPGGSGAGIYKPSGGPWQAVSLTAIGVTFRDNVAIVSAQDDGGGALYATGMDQVILYRCLFDGNRGSNGGAVYSLGSKSLKVVESDFLDNRATGTSGNPGSGGNGGAIGVDGAARQVEVCGSRFLANRANAFGVGFFTVMYDGASSTTFDATTFEGNVNPTTFGFAAGAYLQGGPFAVRRSTFEGNEANGVGALFLGPGATGVIENTTFYGNVARQGLGGALFISTSGAVTIASSTIFANRAPGAGSFAAGIQVDATNAVTMRNTILAGNTAGNAYNPWNIRNPVGDGGGNLQYPPTRPNGQAETSATPTVLWADPQLTVPGFHGGPTRTLALPAASPAVGAGVGAGAPATDQRGEPRTPPVDVGAFERGGLIFSDGFELGDLSAWSP